MTDSFHINGTPVPDRIAALPRDWRGYPVPWVAEWSSELDVPHVVERTVSLPGFAWEGMVINTSDNPGEGKPSLGKVEPGRQLRAHETPQCNVCGAIIGRKLHFVGGLAEPQCYTEAPLHRECARFALNVCPKLVTATDIRGAPLVVTVVNRDDLAYIGRFIGPDEQITQLNEQRARDAARYVPLGLLTVVAIPIRGVKFDSKEWLAR